MINAFQFEPAIGLRLAGYDKDNTARLFCQQDKKEFWWWSEFYHHTTNNEADKERDKAIKKIH